MSKRYTQQTCPKSDTWFAEGGRCGWAHCCAECDHLGQVFVPGLDSDGSEPMPVEIARLRAQIAALQEQRTRIMLLARVGCASASIGAADMVFGKIMAETARQPEYIAARTAAASGGFLR